MQPSRGMGTCLWPFLAAQAKLSGCPVKRALFQYDDFALDLACLAYGYIQFGLLRQRPRPGSGNGLCGTGARRCSEKRPPRSRPQLLDEFDTPRTVDMGLIGWLRSAT
jgi:hypothetical protein